MIRNMRGMVSAAGEISDRVQAGRMNKFETCGLPPPEPCAQVRILLGAHITAR